MPIQKTEIDKAPYIAYADKPGMIYDGTGGGASYGTEPVVIEFRYEDFSAIPNIAYLFFIISEDRFVFYPGSFGDGGDTNMSMDEFTTLPGVEIGFGIDLTTIYNGQTEAVIAQADDLETIVINQGGLEYRLKKFIVPNDVSELVVVGDF